MNGYIGAMYTHGRNHSIALEKRGTLPRMKYTRGRVEGRVIKYALSYVFRSEHVQILSWGTKRIMHDGKWVRFPAVERKMSLEHLWRTYENEK